VIRAIAAVIVALLSVGCSLPPVVKMPDEPTLPTEFGRYGGSASNKLGCPQIDGDYRNEPLAIEITNGEKKHVQGGSNSFFSLFSLHLAKRTEGPLRPGESAIDVLELELREDGILSLVYPAPDVGKVFYYEYSNHNGDFHCLNGTLTFPIIHHYGSGELTRVNGQSQVKLRIADSGSLVAIKSFGPYRSRHQVGPDQFTHQFYLYQIAQ
jgi:hypothetical protein